MKDNANLIRFLVAVSVIICVTQCTNALKVTVYYESLCPDSVRFIGRQLYPYWNDLVDYIDEMELVPYGKATHIFYQHNATFNLPAYYEFSCQHGQEECKGNKYQACALAQNKGKYVEVPLVFCIMRNRNPSSFNVVKNCAERYRLDISKLKTCCDSIEGDQLLAIKGDKTWELEPNINFVPTIVFNEKFDRTTQSQSLQDFVAVVCSKIQNKTKPTICDGKQLPLIDY
ncbi:GILT-like protein 1 [Diorhabda sublineata]|uniref:GILT-like protein 1 n=1 Tax=Diorhabda sublineata TaxID=1163346 RepID=UPI0024E07254|nr:GILT-like protein 1 [Diorhabda sublineata]